MDFGALPPEINSGRMYSGPGAASLLAASAGWEALAADLHGVSAGCQAVITRLTDETWGGPSSMSMVGAVAPYLQWMRTAAVQCETAATGAAAAATAYETAFAMTVPPPAIMANRARLAMLIASNSLGQNAPAIGATEAEYGEMWARDAAAMYNYAASSSAASAFEVFSSPPPPPATKLSGRAASARLISSVPRTLRRLATPGGKSAAPADDDADGGVAAGLGDADLLGTLSVPPTWADVLSVATPEPVLDANVMPGGWGAKPLGAVSRRAVRPNRLRPKDISRSSVAG